MNFCCSVAKRKQIPIMLENMIIRGGEKKSIHRDSLSNDSELSF